MAKDKRKGWLRNLEVGSPVLVQRGGSIPMQLGKVVRVTPSGQMVIQYKNLGEQKFPYSGVLKLGGFSTVDLVEVTPRSIARRELALQRSQVLRELHSLSRINIEFLTLEEVQSLRDLIQPLKEFLES